MRLRLLCLFFCLAPGVAAQPTHVVLIGGLGGSAAHTDAFRQYLFDTRRALTDGLGVPPERITVLAERKLAGEAFVDGVALADTIRARFAALAARTTPDDLVLVVLYGHGSYDGTHAYLNIPRRDLSEADYAALLAPLKGTVVFVNTAGASGPFAAALAAPGRVVITATRSGTQRLTPVFPRYFVEALTTPAADADRDGDLTVREVFVYAASRTARHYEETAHLATEQALLEDTGAGQGVRLEELDAGAGGHRAAAVYLRRAAPLAGADAAEKARLERAIAELKARKADLTEDAYYAELESLFVRLARLNDRLEAGSQ